MENADTSSIPQEAQQEQQEAQQEQQEEQEAQETSRHQVFVTFKGGDPFSEDFIVFLQNILESPAKKSEEEIQKIWDETLGQSTYFSVGKLAEIVGIIKPKKEEDEEDDEEELAEAIKPKDEDEEDKLEFSTEREDKELEEKANMIKLE